MKTKPEKQETQKRKASYSPWQQERAHSRRQDDYHERQTQIHGKKGCRDNHVCCECRKTFKVTRSDYRFLRNLKSKHSKPENEFPTCPNCGSKRFYRVGVSVRVPRRDASDRTWKRFEYLFIDHQGWCTRDQQDQYRKQELEAKHARIKTQSGPS